MLSPTDPDSSLRALNMSLIGHCDLGGRGNGGEGMSLVASRARRILYIAHESGPVNFSIVDVTNPRKLRLIGQTALAHGGMRSNSLAASGDLLAVAYQVAERGGKPAGMELFDITRPHEPRSVGFFDTSGPKSRGTHCLWFVDGRYAYLSTGMPDFKYVNPLDDQFCVIVDVADPTRPVEVGRWWLPGTCAGDNVPPLVRHPRFDLGYRTHNINVYPDRPDRAYVGYLDGGVVILDIDDKSRPRMISNLDYHPPMPGFTHTVLPLFERKLLAVTDESVVDGGVDHPKLLWIMDASTETNIVPIATAPSPPPELRLRGGRYGTHNLHENEPLPTAFHSETLLFGAFFNAGVRAIDITDPFQPRLIGQFIPKPPETSPVRAIQINDVYVDENRLIYAIDRFAGGLYVLEFTA